MSVPSIKFNVHRFLKHTRNIYIYTTNFHNKTNREHSYIHNEHEQHTRNIQECTRKNVQNSYIHTANMHNTSTTFIYTHVKHARQHMHSFHTHTCTNNTCQHIPSGQTTRHRSEQQRWMARRMYQLAPPGHQVRPVRPSGNAERGKQVKGWDEGVVFICVFERERDKATVTIHAHQLYTHNLQYKLRTLDLTRT